MVFYLKYRPQKIDDLDSEQVRERLTKIFTNKSEAIPHAFLFTGPKGLGKTSAARIIAKTVNCTNRTSGNAEPCNKCESCKSITMGTNLDVLEIDGASNRGIDEMRDLREKIRLAPASGMKKVYIIDEVHMLTTEAFNALLKTLEEPPDHAIFILCTTEPQKVPATIISRCLHISFKSPTQEEMKRSFKRIIKGEGLNIDDKGLESILKLSDGSFRDGAKVLEEIALNFGKKKVDSLDIESIFNTSTITESVKDLVIFVSAGETRKALSILDSLSQQKIDFKYFSENLLSFLHSLLLVKYDVVKDSEMQKFLTEKEIDADKLKVLIQEFSQAHSQIKFSVSPQIPLEIAAIELTQNASETKIESPKQPQEEKIEVVEKKVKTEVGNDDKILIELIDIVNKSNRSVAGLLRGVKMGSDDQEMLHLMTAYKFHKDKLDQPNVKSLIEKAYEDITGNKKKIEITLRG